jgi:hypothetical protein
MKGSGTLLITYFTMGFIINQINTICLQLTFTFLYIFAPGKANTFIPFNYE